MKIKMANGKLLDTDKLSDKNAEIHEALNNLYLVCQKYGVAGMARILLTNEDHIGMLFLPNNDGSADQESYQILAASIGEWLTKTSGGRLQLIDTEAGNEETGSNESGGKE